MAAALVGGGAVAVGYTVSVSASSSASLSAASKSRKKKGGAKPGKDGRGVSAGAFTKQKSKRKDEQILASRLYFDLRPARHGTILFPPREAEDDSALEEVLPLSGATHAASTTAVGEVRTMTPTPPTVVPASVSQTGKKKSSSSPAPAGGEIIDDGWTLDARRAWLWLFICRTRSRRGRGYDDERERVAESEDRRGG
ncbi:hypothetical protein R3P38DRAFT_3240020 [Favolaschia claudopus]|uniref:Uncharacterized protein n=1 Tax=Favolaschia claudopus TaxID=2862362 RepID=A0AAV9Z7V0_9AGAR